MVIDAMNVQKLMIVLFALAFALTLCNNEDPTETFFHQSQMREHLQSCFAKTFVESFPTLKKTKRRRKVLRVERIQIHCSCRPPDNGTACHGEL
jgi:hypothetical protein